MRLCKFLSLLCFCIMASGCASNGGVKNVGDTLMFWKDKDEKETVEIPKIEVEGLDKKEELKTFIETIITDTFEDVESEEDLDYAQEIIATNVNKAMQSKGYYNADVEYKYGNIRIQPGSVTRIGAITITPQSHEPRLKDLKLKANDPLDADAVFNAQSKLYKDIQDKNCAVETDVRHRVFLNQQTQKADIYFEVIQSKDAKFGDLTFSGNKTVKNKYLKKLTKWEEGNCFDQNKIQDMRTKILQTNLFQNVAVELPDDAAKRDIVPVDLQLQERKHRTVKAGVSYYTDEGIGTTLGWEHRNYFGSGEKLAAELSASMLEQSLGLNLSKPYFLHPKQSLSLYTELSREENDAFTSLGLDVGASIKRNVSKKYSWSTGLDLSFEQIEEDGEDDKEIFGLLKPFIALNYDSRDKPLDAKKGLLAFIKARPTFDILGESDPFIKNEAGVQTYFEVKDDIVLASRFKFGTILGNSTEDLPATERFYSGGGGSVRGFGFQDIGPFEDGDPVGGRSLIEISNEARFKVTETLGGVIFVDAGKVDDLIFPGFDDIAIGAGAGVRYYTGFGPLRFDVGVPLQGDENTDQSYQFYISIGQAF